MNRTTNLLAISAMTVAFAMLTTSAFVDAAIFVKVQGIPGDSTLPGDPENDGWFVADSFSFGVDRDIDKKAEKGGTKDLNIGIGELHEVEISKSLDISSAALAQSAINGNSVGSVEICFVQNSGSDEAPKCYLHYVLDRVFIKGWSTEADADDRPTEEVAFYYNKIAFAYATTTDGKNFERGGAMAWDNVQNVKWTSILDTIWDIMGLGNIR